MTVVSNTSPITNFAGIGKIDLLQQLYGMVTIPQGVYQEIVGVGKVVPGALEAQSLAWIIVCPVNDLSRVATLRKTLDSGEAEAIALAQEQDAELLIIDEKPGRTFARQLGINIIGVLGVLLEAKRKNLISGIRPLIDQLINQLNFRVSKQLYAAVIQAANEI
jgi:hypothetical protein